MDKNFMGVICISVRNIKPPQTEIGKYYYIDRNSIWIDKDGDAYGTVYNVQGFEIGFLKLSRFVSA